MIKGLSELIESHNVQSHQLKSVKSIIVNFNKAKMPSMIQYAKLVNDLNNVVLDEE